MITIAGWLLSCSNWVTAWEAIRPWNGCAKLFNWSVAQSSPAAALPASKSASRVYTRAERVRDRLRHAQSHPRGTWNDLVVKTASLPN